MNPSKKRLFIITGAVFAAVALALLLIGGYMSGWDIAGWFTSTPAYILYFMLALYALFAFNLFFWDWIKRR